MTIKNRVSFRSARRELVYQMKNYGYAYPEEGKRKLAPVIVADTVLAVNRLLLAEGIGLQVSMAESADGENMFCILRSPLN